MAAQNLGKIRRFRDLELDIIEANWAHHPDSKFHFTEEQILAHENNQNVTTAILEKYAALYRVKPEDIEGYEAVKTLSEGDPNREITLSSLSTIRKSLKMSTDQAATALGGEADWVTIRMHEGEERGIFGDSMITRELLHQYAGIYGVKMESILEFSIIILRREAIAADQAQIAGYTPEEMTRLEQTRKMRASQLAHSSPFKKHDI